MSSTREVLDLGTSPPANWLKRTPMAAEESFPLILESCETCGNVQLRDTLSAEILYRDYLYVTPASSMLTAHYDYLLSYLLAKGYFSDRAFVVEAGSNVGLFLAYIRDRVGSVLGIDPAERIAEIANAAGIPTICDYFSRERAERVLADRGPVDAVVARHCLAHNESPHEMLDAAFRVLAEDGFIVIENAYLLNTIENGEFDQIYHEHMFYFSIRSMTVLLALHGMRLVDVMMSLVHGGSIVFVAAKGLTGPVGDSVASYQARENLSLKPQSFVRFAKRAREIRARLLEVISEFLADGRTIYTYGATAKGNTLLNYAGIDADQVPYCVDNTPLKQGLFLPKSNIEIISEEAAAKHPPDYFLLTAWNYQDEIVTKVRHAGNYHSRFIVPIPSVRIV